METVTKSEDYTAREKKDWLRVTTAANVGELITYLVTTLPTALWEVGYESKQ